MSTVSRSPQQPNLVTCGAIVCSKCCCSWLEVKHELVCPCCYGDHLKDAATIRPPCSLVLDTLSSISVACSRCKNKFPLSDYTPHLQSSCQYVPVDGVLQEILHNPVTEPLSPVESALRTVTFCEVLPAAKSNKRCTSSKDLREGKYLAHNF